MSDMEVGKHTILILAALLGGCVLEAPPIRARSGHAPESPPREERPQTGPDLHYSPNAVQHTFYEVGQTVDPALSWDGKTLYYASSQDGATFDIYCKQVGEIPAVKKTFHAADDMQPSVSPDGRLLAFVSNRNGNWDIFLKSLAPGAEEVRLTGGETDDISPSWSPDGRRIVYSSYNARAERWELMMITLSKEGWETASLNTEGLFPAWRPVKGSETIVFQKPRGRAPQLYGLWTVSSDGRNLVEIVGSTAFGAVTPAWTRDGRWIVFSSVPAERADEGRAGNLWMVGMDGKGLAKISEGSAPEYAPVCAPDGTVYFTTRRSGIKNIWSLTPDFGNNDEGIDERKGIPVRRSDDVKQA
ncbi:MAG: hypothetical protein DRP79_00655 [Planctomycetota bacterium]|nr:MAG: hypothetical protein DRP79_00655 [Planctomycetota bacterium]